MQNKFNVHIVDSNTNNVNTIRNLLLANGFFVSASTSVEACLLHFSETARQYDLIIANTNAENLQLLCSTVNPQNVHSYNDIEIPIVGFINSETSPTAEEANNTGIAFFNTHDINTLYGLGVVDCLHLPLNHNEVLHKVSLHTGFYHAKKLLSSRNILLTKSQKNISTSEIEETQREMIYVLTDLMEANPQEVGAHMQRMAKVAYILADNHPDISKEDASLLLNATPMHDIGTTTLPPELIYKQGKYTADEFEQMKSHTVKGYNLLKNSKRPIMQVAAIVAHEHQEKWDGTGYPRGLQGTEIHIFGRIVALADVFDSLLKKRSYTESLTFDKAVEHIQTEKAKHFDPKLVDIFLENLDKFKEVYH